MEQTNQRKNIVVLGIFKHRAALETCANLLKSSGFRSRDISVLFQTGDQSKDFAHVAGTKLPEGASTGAASGAVLGGVLGWLVGIGSLAIPGVGPMIAAGPIMATLAGAGIGSAVGGLTGALVGYGFTEYEAKRFEGAVSSGGTLLSVHCDNSAWANKAMEMLKNSGAENVSRTQESSSPDSSTTAEPPRTANV